MSHANELAAWEAAARIASGELSSVELVQACLDRIAERDDTVQAWTYLDPDYALSQAREADGRQAEGKGIGPLHGVPVGIKDIIDTAGMPTENGSPIFAGRSPNKDAFCVSALRDAGAVVLGKTVTTELANRSPGKTRNPHNPEHTPGGSSSGSCAGVADFQVPLALGTQTGGSVIRPSSYCGVYGLKPTLGLISRTGVLLQSHTLDTVGVHTRSVEDLALGLEVMSHHDPQDAVSYPRGRGDYQALVAAGAERAPRFAFVRTPGWDVATAAAQAAIEGVAGQLGDQCDTVDLPAPFDRITALHRSVMGPEDLTYYGRYLEETPELLSEEIRDLLIKARAVPAHEYVKAINARAVIYRDLEALLSRYDAVLCLPSPGSAPKGLDFTGDAIFNGLWTYLGVPCVTLPRLTVDGLPCGVQLVGLRNDEGRLLRTAKWLDNFLG